MATLPMAALRSRLEAWIKDRTASIGGAWRLPAMPAWPWAGGIRLGWRERERLAKAERERQRQQLRELCRALRADTVAEVQELLSAMVLAECVYKRPSSELIRYINKFKFDFGGQLVCLERVQPSLDHVPHRYVLAESGDTLFASFIGTKQYKDVITDVNILQGTIFHEDDAEGLEDIVEQDLISGPKKLDEKHKRKKSKPAVHKGFLARAKGIPALELYNLAQRKNRKLILCGHSLGGAVAALATLVILRAIACSSVSKEHKKLHVKCITFSQPPVGNAALRDFVYDRGWEDYFRTYCIPEDLVPRILSPAYFHHYNVQASATHPGVNQIGLKTKESVLLPSLTEPKENSRIVLSIGPVQRSLWRLSKLVPLEAVRKRMTVVRRPQAIRKDSSIGGHIGSLSKVDDAEVELPHYLEIQEDSGKISLTTVSEKKQESGELNDYTVERSSGTSTRWGRVPYLPSYVPFGQLYLLGDSSITSLSDSEYSKMTSVKSVFLELKERLQSHSMKSYRSRFQKIFDLCMPSDASPFLSIEQVSQFSHLQKLLGLAAVDSVKLGDIVEPPVVRTATSLLPLGWNGQPGDRNAYPIKVDIIGNGLHLCTKFQAKINGNWCSTIIESLPSPHPYLSSQGEEPALQKMRISVSAPLRRPPSYNDTVESRLCEDISVTECSISKPVCQIFCVSDFFSICSNVHMRTRRVRLIGFEGAGKSSLFKALVHQNKQRCHENLRYSETDFDFQEAVSGGVCYSDSAGVKLQDLPLAASKFREELHQGAHDLNKKTDLIIFVHNLTHKINHYSPSSNSKSIPLVSLLLNEAKSHCVPWVLAVTNKFSSSADQLNKLVDAVMQTYRATPDMTVVVNSVPDPMQSASSTGQPGTLVNGSAKRRDALQVAFFPSVNLTMLPYQKKDAVRLMPVEGVGALRELVHQILLSNEDTAFQELANERLALELMKEKRSARDVMWKYQSKDDSAAAAALGASIGAGVGVVLAIIMGAGSALRKP